MKKVLLFISLLIVSIFTLNVKLYASNPYYLISCTEQNIPIGYYESVDTSSEAKIRESLCNIISTGYVGGSYNNAFTVDSYADADPYNEGNVICIYTGQSIANAVHGTGGWDREHIWCKSHGFKGRTKSGGESSATANEAYNDCHHLRAAEHMTNVNRSDKDFGELANPTSTDEYGCKWTDTIFEPRDEVKGDVARMLFYMMIRYGEYCKDTFPTYIDDVETEVSYGLALVDQDVTTTSTGDGRLGKLSTLLKWHYQDPVSDREIYRNNVVYTFQKNRNPFIDHPEYVDLAFVNSIGSYTEATSNPKVADTDTRTEVLYKEIGFEESEGFAVQTTFNGTYSFGNKDEKWNTNYAAVGASNAITGSQSMQMRWYSSTPLKIPECSMTYDVDNLSKVSFSAKGVNGGKISVMYSYDEGVTWHTNEEISITSSKATYTSVITNNGGLGDLRVGFKMVLPNSTTSNTTYYLDDVKLYRCKDSAGSEISKQTTKANLNFAYDENRVTKQISYYQVVTDVSQISVGDEIIIGTQFSNTTGDHLFGMGDRTGTRMSGITASLKDNILTSSDAISITLDSGTTAGTYSLKWNNQYLGNDSSTSYQLIPYSSKSDSTSFTITIENGVTYLKLMSTQTYKDDGTTIDKKAMELQFNSSQSYFACYRGTQKPIFICKKITEEQTVTEYTYHDAYLRFAGIINVDLYNDVLAEDANAVFGVAISKDGVDFTTYECQATKANLVNGLLVDSEDGTYVYFACRVLTPTDHFDENVYAKAYVVINGTTYYMNQRVFSVNSLVEYYLNNTTLSAEQTELLEGLGK